MLPLCLLFVALGVRAELVDDDAPPKKPKIDATKGDPTKSAFPKVDVEGAQERLPLEIDEPGFKAKAVFPEQPVPKYEQDSRSNKVVRPASRRAWALPQEEGVEIASAPEATENSDSKEVTVEISPALAKVIAKEKSGKKLKDVLAMYKEVVAAEPENVEAHYRLGLAMARNDESRSAAAELEKCINMQPKNLKYMCDFGLLALQAGWLEKATLACQTAAVGQPANARYQSALGDCLLGSGKITAAADAYKRAVNLEPDNSEYIHNLALAHLHGKAFKKCLEIVNEAIKSHPDHAAYYCTRGLAQENTKNVKDAIEDYKLAVALDKNNAYAHYLLACVYSDPNDPTFTSAFEAIEHANRAVTITQGRNALYLMGLARASRVGRNYDLAVDAAKRAIMLDPRDEYKKELGEFQKLKGDSILK
jgi:tetratricopeptide (TPR) repeat protein